MTCQSLQLQSGELLDKDVRGRLRQAQRGHIPEPESMDETMDKAISIVLGILVGCIIVILFVTIVEIGKELMILLK